MSFLPFFNRNKCHFLLVRYCINVIIAANPVYMLMFIESDSIKLPTVDLDDLSDILK